MLKDSARLLCLATLSLLLLCFALLGMCRVEAAATPVQTQTQQEVTVKVPLSKLTELRSLIDKQEQRVEQLETLLEGQSSTLSGQQNSIIQLRQELATAKSSLANSKLIIDEQNSSLMSLSEKLKADARREKRIKRQRSLWQIIAGGMTVALVRKAV